MINKQEMDFLILQIQNIITGKPVLEKFDGMASSEFKKLEENISYLSTCLIEANEFVYSLCNGKLDVAAPGRYNFLTGNLKELHSILKYLTWQTTQVAEGDYRQRVNFLGEFSDAFNLMITQLEEREIGLNEKTKALSQSMDLLVSIMDAQKDGILVINVDNQQVIYTNQIAKNRFFNDENKQGVCNASCPLFQHLKEMTSVDRSVRYEYYCAPTLRHLVVTSSPIHWHGQQALVHCLTDVSAEKENAEILSSLAYKDDLTGLYNRRYCIETLVALSDQRAHFSLVVLDLDGMKHVNDTFGHVTGDEYICTVVDILQQHTDETTILCRIGGDEFVAIFKKSSEETVHHKMEEIYQAVLHTKKSYPLSASYGITYFSGEQYHSADEMLRLSDRKMYAFKKTHRR